MTPWVARLLYANVLMFLLTAVFQGVKADLAFIPALALRHPWTLLTYSFLHGDIWHIAFNMLGLFFFGPRLEMRLGGKRFLWLYGLGALGGAALSFVFAPHAAVIGASGALFGVLVGYAHFWPREPIYIWGIVPVQARVLVIFFALLSFWLGFGQAAGGIAHFAHLGGFVAGYAYVRWVDRRRRPAAAIRPLVAEPKASDDVRVRAWEAIRPESMHSVNREELERVLEKLRDVGPARLTADERAFLDRFATY